MTRRQVPMNLKHQLIVRIVLIALASLIAVAVYALRQAHAESQRQAQATTATLVKQLQFQLLRIDAGFGDPKAFPDFSLWQAYSATPGTCIRFMAAHRPTVRSACTGDALLGEPGPRLFADGYRQWFKPGLPIIQPILYNHVKHGELQVTVNDRLEIAGAYADLTQLLGLSALTVLAVCLSVYVSLDSMLRPARRIVAGLTRMRAGDLRYRLPDFALQEWRQTAAAINQLAHSQQQLLQERERLALKLLTLQEQERRALASELHDEFGQCLAAINALIASINQTATARCPELLAETLQIGDITQHIMDNLRGLLMRLRPAELDELGLAVSLDHLLQGWTARSRGQTAYHLAITGDCEQLPQPLPMTVYRIVQECLTNAAKHAAATDVTVQLDCENTELGLHITDNGVAAELPFTPSGIGLLGIAERVAAVGGQLSMTIVETGGLNIAIRLPIIPDQHEPRR